jgi:tRNA threonylcarbamoyladenosine biosynthesis protein TsaB
MKPEWRILAVDTATRCCSAAVLVGERLAAETAVRSEHTHSEHLIGMVQEVLKSAGLKLQAINGMAVSIGPGSFTGLRIGISTIQGLALAGGIPCVGVSSLEALAGAALPWPQGICALIDARKGEVYAGRYRERNGGLEQLAPEQVLPLEVLLRTIDGPHLFIGDGAERYQGRIQTSLGDLARFAPPERNFPRAGTLARLAQPRLAVRAGTLDASLLVPSYLRQSDAELHLRGSSGVHGAADA